MPARFRPAALALCLGGCSTPLGYLDTHGTSANIIAQLGWGLLTISIVVIAIISALVLAATFRSRSIAEDDQLAVRRDGGGMNWIYVGVGISVVALVASVIWTLLTLRAVAEPNSTPALTIDVDAHQWWWEAAYRSSRPELEFTTANELHIPVGMPVRVNLTSDDVIHSFWVPKLAGKTDVIPDQQNSTWIEAKQPGVYRGQCAEYCGVEHALMSFRVVAEPLDQFNAWRARQLRGTQVHSLAGAAGALLFAAHCGACHASRNSGGGGIYGPNLTNLGERRTLAAGVLPNTPGNLGYWIRHAQQVKPGARMPDIPLAQSEVAPIVAYLEGR